MGYLWSSGKFYHFEVTICYSKYKWIDKKINLLCNCLSPSLTWFGYLHGSSFRNWIWHKYRIMDPWVKQISFWTQLSKWKLVWYYKTGRKMMCCHQSQVDPCVFYWKDPYILTNIDDCVIFSHKQETIPSIIESLNNGPENYVLKDEGDLSNYLGVNIKKIQMGHSNYRSHKWWRKLSTVLDLQCPWVSKQ